MRRRELLTGSGTIAAAALAGCLGSADDGDEGTASDASSRTIVVSKSGTATAAPDLAIITVGVEATADSADAVRDELATRSAALEDALLAYGIDEDDITTSRYDIRERPDRRRTDTGEADPDSREDAEEDVHYVGTHSFRVEVRNVDEAGAVVDVAVDAGADTVDRIHFTLSDERRAELRETALEDALEDARSEAEFVADRIDATVVEVEMIDTAGGRVSPVSEDVEMAAAADDAAPPTEFQPGEVTVTATVDVRYEIE